MSIPRRCTRGVVRKAGTGVEVCGKGGEVNTDMIPVMKMALTPSFRLVGRWS